MLRSSRRCSTHRRSSDGPSKLDSVGWLCIARWRNTAADYYAAASRYEALAALSDAELSRRGLSRTTLGATCAPPATAAPSVEPVTTMLVRE